MAAATVAVTGATGFVGTALCAALAGQGRTVRTLVRRPDKASGLPSGVEVVAGSLDDEPALTALVDGAETVVHVAGLIAARRPEDFHRVNAGGTARLIAAIRRMGTPCRLLLVSSLAARRPEASAYAASKRAAEGIVADAGLEHCIVRPPVVYGPGDRASLPIIRQLARGLIVVPRVQGARFSLLYVDDLALLVCRLIDASWAGEVIEPDDGRVGGYAWADLAAIAGHDTGRTVRCLGAPRPVVWGAALAQEVGGALTGRAPMLSRGKLGELWYPDWVCRSGTVPKRLGWAPEVDFADGFSQSLAWYRRNRWI